MSPRSRVLSRVLPEDHWRLYCATKSQRTLDPVWTKYCRPWGPELMAALESLDTEVQERF